MEIMRRHRLRSQEITLTIVPGPPRIAANAILFDQSVTTVAFVRAFSSDLIAVAYKPLSSSV
jgi:hypothetical protein